MPSKKLTPEQRTEEIAKLKAKSESSDVFTRKNITEEDESLANGIVETSSLFGTVIGLAIVAPLTATKLIHPILKGVGLDKTEKTEQTKEIEHDDHDDD